MRPAGGAHPAVCVGPNTPVLVKGTLYWKKFRLLGETLNRGPDSLWSLKIPGCPSKKSWGVTLASWSNSPIGL